MGYYSRHNRLYDGMSDEEVRLYKKWQDAEDYLREFKSAMDAPIGSFRWEAAVHSGDTVESLERAVQHYRKEYFNYRNR